MDAALIQALVVKLLLAVEGLTGYPAPAAAPAVVFLPHGELERRACSGPCAVFGWFPPGDTVYLDDRLDPLADVQARAVLLHELVHYLQQEHGAFPGPPSCRTWLDKEHEAFDVEGRWLAAQPREEVAAAARRTSWRRPDWAGRVPLQVFCRDETTPPAQARPAGVAPRE